MTAQTAHTLTGIADGAIRFVLTVLPIALLLTVPILVPGVWFWRRSRRRSTTSPPTRDERSATSPPSGGQGTAT